MNEGLIKLSDGTTLKLRAFIMDIREKPGPSPFLVNLVVNPIAGISASKIPENVKNLWLLNRLHPKKFQKKGGNFWI
jgi:hypothetical protein